MAKKSAAAPKTKTEKKAKVANDTTPTRVVKQSSYRSLRLSKRIKHPSKPIPSAFKIFRESVRQLVKNWWLFGGITIVYLILSIILVKGFGSNNNILQLKDTIQSTFSGSTAALSTSLTLFGSLLSNVSNTNSPAGSTYQTLLLLIISLVLIWALRHSAPGKKNIPGIRDAFYKSLYPLVPFMLILIVIGFQLVPIVISNFLYTTVFGGGLAATPIEKGLWALFFIIMFVFSFYMITSSLFALYIVTLPDLRPVAALRSARELVRHRRVMVFRKIIFLPFALLVLASIIIVPIIIWSPVAAEWTFYVLSMAALAIFHSYMYNLYRSLL